VSQSFHHIIYIMQPMGLSTPFRLISKILQSFFDSSIHFALIKAPFDVTLVFDVRAHLPIGKNTFEFTECYLFIFL
jgi:hypothetical protein